MAWRARVRLVCSSCARSFLRRDLGSLNPVSVTVATDALQPELQVGVGEGRPLSGCAPASRHSPPSSCPLWPAWGTQCLPRVLGAAGGVESLLLPSPGALCSACHRVGATGPAVSLREPRMANALHIDGRGERRPEPAQGWAGPGCESECALPGPAPPPPS